MAEVDVLGIRTSDPLLELLVVTFNAPTQLGVVDQPLEADVFRKCREPIFDRLLLALRPSDQQPFFRPAIAELVARERRKPRGECFRRAFTPGDRTPGAC